MHAVRLILATLLIPLAVAAADRPLKIDRTRTFIDVDVKATFGSFTGHLDNYDLKVTVDAPGKIKSTVFSFKFADLKTGEAERDKNMIKWLGGGDPTGLFEVGNLAITPDGQGQVSGRLTFHGKTERVEFPINVVKADGVFTVTGETTIDYRQWDLKVIKMALVAKVDPEVKIRFKLTGTVAAAEPAK